MKTETGLAVFDPLKTQIAEFKEENLKLVFDYEDPQGNKDARSHIFKLRKVKTKIADVHKVAKAEALEYCRAVDAQKNALIVDVEEMIAVHDEPIKHIEEREKAEEAERQRKIQEEKDRAEAQRQAELEAREAAVRQQEEKQQAEKEAREAAERAKQAQIEQAAREKEIAEKATAKAEAAAKKALEDAEKKRLADIEAERQRAKAEAEAKELAELKRREAEAAEKAKAEAAEKRRIENEAHRKKVHDDIGQAFMVVGLDQDDAEAVLQALIAKQIPRVSINY